MKNLLYTAGIITGLLTGGNAYNASAQDSSSPGNINVEKISIDVKKQSEYGKKFMTRENMMNNPYMINSDSLTVDELKRLCRTVIINYENTLTDYGNIKPDLEAVKIENSELKKVNKTLTNNLESKTRDLRECLKEN